MVYQNYKDTKYSEEESKLDHQSELSPLFSFFFFFFFLATRDIHEAADFFPFPHRSNDAETNFR